MLDPYTLPPYTASLKWSSILSEHIFELHFAVQACLVCIVERKPVSWQGFVVRNNYWNLTYLLYETLIMTDDN